MIKTLRITIIVTAILAVVFFVLSAVFGLRHDKDKEAFLAKPSATEVFKKNAANTGSAEVEAPLIKQAQEFTLRINPPKPREEISLEVHKPVVEAPKFKLLGTSIYPQDPQKSMALIDEPGKGMHWVVPSDKIDYLTIVRIEDGKIIYTDGKNQMEMLAEKLPEVPGIIVLSGPGAKAASVPEAPKPGIPVPLNAAQTPAETSSEGPTAEEIKSNAEFIRKLMAEANEAKEKGQSTELGISSEEANDLQGLGEFLKQVEQEQKQAEEANAVPAAPVDPNSQRE